MNCWGRLGELSQTVPDAIRSRMVQYAEAHCDCLKDVVDKLGEQFVKLITTENHSAFIDQLKDTHDEKTFIEAAKKVEFNIEGATDASDKQKKALGCTYKLLCSPSKGVSVASGV